MARLWLCNLPKANPPPPTRLSPHRAVWRVVGVDCVPPPRATAECMSRRQLGLDDLLFSLQMSSPVAVDGGLAHSSLACMTRGITAVFSAVGFFADVNGPKREACRGERGRGTTPHGASSPLCHRM